MINWPYAHELVMAAHDLLLEKHPDADNLTYVESEGCSGVFFDVDNARVLYDPEAVMEISQNHLLDVLESIYMHYLLSVIPLHKLAPASAVLH